MSARSGQRDDPSPVDRLVRGVRRALGEDRRVIVAVSGGGDSVALLRLLLEPAGAPRILSVAHMDHGARPDSAADAAWVRGLAGRLEVPFDLGHWAPTRRGHFETDARRARYAWLAETARARGATAVVTAHTKDDQAETVLHRIVRGTGLRGLAGMSPRRSLCEGVDLVRPLLDTDRAELRAYLAGIGQVYREDSTNSDLTRTRARLRHDLIPKLERDYNPEVVDALARLGRMAREVEHERDVEIAAALAERMTRTEGGGLRLRLDGLSTGRRAEMLRAAWRLQGWPQREMSERRWMRLAGLADAAEVQRFELRNLRVTGGGGFVEIRPIEPPSEPPDLQETTLPVPGEVAWGDRRIGATFDESLPADERIDFDRVVGGLTVRGPRPGDRFRPLGMTGEKSLRDMLREARVPANRRRAAPLVCDEAGIVWVVGLRIADRVRRTGSTVRALGLWARAAGCD